MTTTSHSLGEPDFEAVRAAQIIESVVGNAWAADAAGRFTYMTPAVLSFLGTSLEELSSPSGESHFGWKRIIHPDDYDSAIATWRRCLQTGEPYAFEHRILRSSGAYGWCRSSGQPLRDGHGRIFAWYGTVIDSTAPSIVNERLGDTAGATLQKKDASDVPHSLNHVDQDDQTAAAHAPARAIWTGIPQVTRYRQLLADGNYGWAETRSEPEHSVSVDIDDLVRAQEALQQSERRYRDLFHYMPIGLAQIDAGKLVPLFQELRAQGVTELSTYIDAHPEFLPRAMEALEVEEANQHIVDMLAAKNIDDIRGPITRYWQASIPTIRRTIESRYRGEKFFQEETKVTRTDGSVIDVLFTTARPDAVADKSLISFVDITERKKVEEALRHSNRQLEQMIDAVPVNVLSFDPSGKMTYTSKRYLEQVGSPMAHIEDFNALARDVAHPDDFPEMFRRASEGFATGQPFVNRFRRRNKSGLYPWIEARARPLRDANGEIMQWYIASIEIEDEMRALEALRERERFLWQLVETLPAMIDCAAPDGEPVYRSRRLRDFLGYQLEELDNTGKSRLNGTLDAAIHPDELEAVKKQYAHCLATGEPYARRHRLRRFDGEYRWVETRASPMRNAESTIVQWNVICLDIDGEIRAQEELSLAQERLARASQAASLAELSASIAHEVNQPLAAIVANSHACQRWLTAEPPNIERAQRTVERIIRDAIAAADVVSRVRALFRQSADTKALVTVSTIMAEACSLMAEEAVRRRVRFALDIESDLPPVALDKVQIQQVLVNLIRNGMEAMETVPGERILVVCVRWIEDAIQIEIRDGGRGIELPDRVFEPFFTTKEHGMGMGLAICRSIVESHGGRLWVEKNEPQGAVFIFTLPLKRKRAHDD